MVGIEIRTNGDTIVGYLNEDGTVEAYCPIQKGMIKFESVIRWVNYWRDTH